MHSGLLVRFLGLQQSLDRSQNGKESLLVSEADLLLHLSCDGYCRGGADRVVREIASIILNYR